MDEHYIICGIKDVGGFVAQELNQTQRPFVVVDDDPVSIEKLRNEIPTVVSVEGDATDEDILIQAGVKKAKSLIACLETDKENVFLVLEASELNPALELAAKYDSPHTKSKLRKAGASRLVCPSQIGGLRIASELIRPRVVTFLDVMLRDKKETGIRVEQVKVPEGSGLVGKTLDDLYRQTQVLAIACQGDGQADFEYNPDPQTIIRAGMVLIFIATPAKRKVLEEAVA